MQACTPRSGWYKQRRIYYCQEFVINLAQICVIWLPYQPLVILCTKIICFSFKHTHALIITATWCRHQLETLSALLALCAGNSPVTGEFPSQRPVTKSFDVFFVLRLNTRLSKQSLGWWFETSLRSKWRHCNGGCFTTVKASSDYCR